MSVSLTNTRFVQTHANVIDFECPMLESNIPRGARVTFIPIDNTAPDFRPVYGMFMDTLPYNPAWVEVWHDGFRLVNSTLDFGKTFRAFRVSGQVIYFQDPILEGTLKVYADGAFNYDLPEYTIDVNNIQGAQTKNTVDGQMLAGYFCEPVILTEPRRGYVRLSDDRHSLIFIPETGWEGYDSFSYVMINDRGQASEPKCVFITVGEPKGPTKPVTGEGSTDDPKE